MGLPPPAQRPPAPRSHTAPGEPPARVRRVCWTDTRSGSGPAAPAGTRRGAAVLGRWRAGADARPPCAARVLIAADAGHPGARSPNVQHQRAHGLPACLEGYAVHRILLQLVHFFGEVGQRLLKVLQAVPEVLRCSITASQVGWRRRRVRRRARAPRSRKQSRTSQRCRPLTARVRPLFHGPLQVIHALQGGAESQQLGLEHRDRMRQVGARRHGGPGQCPGSAEKCPVCAPRAGCNRRAQLRLASRRVYKYKCRRDPRAHK